MNRIFLVFALLLLVCSVNAQRKYRLPKGISPDHIDREWVIVKTKAKTHFGRNTNSIPLLDSKSSEPSILDGMSKVKVPKGSDPIAFINMLLMDEGILYAEPILGYQPLYAPSDPANGTNQSYLSQISAYDAWDITRGDDDITIGIVDAGLDLDHQDLENSIWTNEADPIDGIDNDENGYIDDYYGWDFADEDNDPTDDGSTHGTRVGGLAGADTDNAVGISGIGFNAKIAALKGFKTVGTTSNNLFEAIIYGADNGMQVLNLSWGSLRDGLQSEQDMIDYAVLEKNVVVVAAAGNTDVDGKFHPASYNHVLSVGATDSNDNKWAFSTYNYSVDIMAPGVSIYATEKNDSYGTDNGTSYASPMVAGTAALVISEFPDLNALQVMERVRVAADDIYSIGNNEFFEGKMGLGRLNVFNAVAQQNLKSLRATDFEATTPLGSSLFFGDTVTVSTNLTNYLFKLSNPQITISSPDNSFTIRENTHFLGNLGTLESDSLSFEIVLSNDLEPESPIAIRLDFQDAAYTDFQFLEAATSPDYVDFGSSVKMTVSGNGNLGFGDAAFFDGIGIEYQGNQILKHVGLMTATSATEVTSNFISDYTFQTRAQGFGKVTNFKVMHHPASDHFAYSEFEDPDKSLIIEQSVHTQVDEDYLIVRYRIVNNTATPIADLGLGFFADFDLNQFLKNKAKYEVLGDYLYTTDTNESLFAGTKIIGNGTKRSSALDVADENGNSADIAQEFTDSDKYNFLTSQQFATAGSAGEGNDVAQLNGLIFDQLGAFESNYFTVILAASDSRVELEAAFSRAEAHLDEIIANPRVLEAVVSCEGAQVMLNPENGAIFQFFQDVDGTILLQEGESFATGVINQDTAFFVRNMDAAYPSELFQIQIKLIEEVAAFKMEPDTLYLDHTTNVVVFTDESLNANSWNWDFGQGTTADIQNPSLSFSQVGEYPISLTVQNSEGCMDTEVKNLVVVQRPQSPVFEEFTICPGNSIMLADPAADYLILYESPDGINETYRGNDLEIGPFYSSTTMYVSGVYSHFESSRVPVAIVVDEFPVDISIAADSLSADNQIIASAITTASIFEWTVNGESRGSTKEIEISSTTEPASIKLRVANAAGCTIIDSLTFHFSSSQIPGQADLTICEGERALIQPSNGTIFGFYQDETLTSLIKKGTQLEVSEATKVFIVGLDDGLPSTPIGVNVHIDQFELQITTEIEKVSNKNRVSLSSNPSSGLDHYKWFLDRMLIETAPSPVIFLENNIYEIIVEAQNENGCIERDTVQLDFIPPLGLKNEPGFKVFPTTSNGFVKLASKTPLQDISIWDISGKIQINIPKVANSLDLHFLSPGIYLVRAQSTSEVHEQRIIIRSD